VAAGPKEKFIESKKMNHRGINSLGVEAGAVKLTPMNSMNSRRATRERAAALA